MVTERWQTLLEWREQQLPFPKASCVIVSEDPMPFRSRVYLISSSPFTMLPYQYCQAWILRLKYSVVEHSNVCPDFIQRSIYYIRPCLKIKIWRRYWFPLCISHTSLEILLCLQQGHLVSPEDLSLQTCWYWAGTAVFCYHLSVSWQWHSSSIDNWNSMLHETIFPNELCLWEMHRI